MKKHLSIMVLGSPGKVIKQVTNKEVEEIKKNANTMLKIINNNI